MAGKRPLLKVRLDPTAAWRLMDRLDISQNEWARRAGLASGYMSELMNGKRSPSSRTRRRLMRALGVAQSEDLFVVEAVDET